jgi:hypothetical protein
MLPLPKLNRQVSIQASLPSSDSEAASQLAPDERDQEEHDDSKFDVVQQETVFSGRGLSILPLLAQRYANIDPSAPTEIQSGFVSNKLLGLQRYSYCFVRLSNPNLLAENQTSY